MYVHSMSEAGDGDRESWGQIWGKRWGPLSSGKGLDFILEYWKVPEMLPVRKDVAEFAF